MREFCEKALRLIDPELSQCGGQKEQSDYEILRWFRLLAAEDKKGKTGDKPAKIKSFT